MAPFSDWTTPAKPGSGVKRRTSSKSRSTGSQSQSAPQLQFFDDLEIWVTRKRVKNINLRICPPDGRVEVSVPWALPERKLSE